VDFKPLRSYRAKDGCVYHKPRKSYTRTHPPKRGWLRIRVLPRENVCIVKLRRLGYSQNIIASFLHRSLSHINRIVKIAEMRGSIPYFSKRKLPSQVRLLSAKQRLKMLSRNWAGWLAFMSGEVDRPP